MEPEEYRQRGKEMVDYICQYLSNVRERRVTPDVQPGYMRAQLPDSAPMDPDSWDNIFGDIEKIIMPGVVHWQSPHMHAYFPALTSWPSLLGDMLADAINCLGFTWASSPACTELEMNVMDWLAKMLGLPDKFLHHHPDSVGGGVLQSTVSESTLVALLAARKNKILEMQVSEPDTDESSLNSRLVAYASDQAHSSVEKAGLISLVKIKFLPVDENFSLRGETLKKAIAEDRKKGLVPVFVCATLGTTGVCAFDNLSELGPVCDAEGLWLHIDAAYAGTAFVCPEFRLFLDGIEYADSFTFNPSKWMMVHFDCTGFWVKDKYKLHQTFSVNPVYLRHANSGAAIDFMHWQIPLSRRFRSLKLWFVLRSFGVKKLQAHVRQGTETAKFFESLVKSDPLFEIPAKRHLGLVVFRLKGPNWLTEKLLKELSSSGRLFLIPATIHDKFIIRFTVTSQFTTREDILQDWSIIQHTAAQIISQNYGFHYINSGGGAGIPTTVVQPTSDAISNVPQLYLDGGKYKTPSRKTVVQPKKLSVSPSQCVISQQVKGQEDPLDDCFPEDVQNVTKHKLTSFLFSYLSVQGKKKTGRSLSCTSVPMTGNVEQCNPKAAATDKKESRANARVLSRLPEDMMMFKKGAFKKLIKFYSVPSFPECSIQCGLQLPCCPLQAIV
ncbi:histidine decarboxylase isoform X1 [Taeniopygia guttata]|uniref:Histidine decarboxylase n=1 Tax=Taeniopygia guttata TaxID=59729 RepID=H0ZB55_TAEGU|nr:histidine decarboxylase isoform X1 [Taeniopygia guttata]